MGKVTIVTLLAATVLVIVAFTKGVNLLYGSRDVQSHLYWGVAALFATLSANAFAMIHAAQSDRVIRELRAALQAAAAQGSVGRGTGVGIGSGGQHGKDV
jgi:hypothetical protein